MIEFAGKSKKLNITTYLIFKVTRFESFKCFQKEKRLEIFSALNALLQESTLKNCWKRKWHFDVEAHLSIFCVLEGSSSYQVSKVKAF